MAETAIFGLPNQLKPLKTTRMNSRGLGLSTELLDETLQGKAFDGVATDTDGKRKFYIESYGCQMNFSDSEIVASVLIDQQFAPTRELEHADLILINTCSIREKAEETVRKRLKVFNKVKRERPGTLIGVLGCMAERLKGEVPGTGTTGRPRRWS